MALFIYNYHQFRRHNKKGKSITVCVEIVYNKQNTIT